MADFKKDFFCILIISVLLQLGGFGSSPIRIQGKSFLFLQRRFTKMSETKRFYWLKLQEDFFEDDTIDFIES